MYKLTKGIVRRNELNIEFTDTSRPLYTGIIKSKLILTKCNRYVTVAQTVQHAICTHDRNEKAKSHNQRLH